MRWPVVFIMAAVGAAGMTYLLLGGAAPDVPAPNDQALADTERDGPGKDDQIKQSPGAVPAESVSLDQMPSEQAAAQQEMIANMLALAGFGAQSQKEETPPEEPADVESSADGETVYITERSLVDQREEMVVRELRGTRVVYVTYVKVDDEWVPKSTSTKPPSKRAPITAEAREKMQRLPRFNSQNFTSAVLEPSDDDYVVVVVIDKDDLCPECPQNVYVAMLTAERYGWKIGLLDFSKNLDLCRRWRLLKPATTAIFRKRYLIETHHGDIRGIPSLFENMTRITW